MDISSWMKDYHLQLNLVKPELLVVSANPKLQHSFSIDLNSTEDSQEPWSCDG